ncbi:hypothetical protein Sta7437_1184 [Stanieria cyanosphaera PCC 7437]|uniref:Uncharacterized protein n=1 Tax=Stanieria cyanosphaera (strain ATCC 29371 / PCC 7437) TaxID=111780 RepID=K9XQ58_STAC7|nr:hypothetical protein [Stanieria cyanosphaera]AFZ34755.1 hypothetical protein Sta7437_1184 [Stanieria cyanosphaera PCC 7437]
MKLTKLHCICLSLAILNTLNILLFTNKTHAQELDCNLSEVKKHSKNRQIAPEQSCQLTKSITASNSSGSPALRRIPNQGEQQFEPTRIPLRIPTYRRSYRAAPSITIINPSGYGAAAGNAGIGVGFQERVRFKNDADGVIGLGFGLGNPQKNIGVQLGVSLVDVSDPFRDGAINLKLHRRLPSDFSVATGVQGIATWGNTDGGSSVYGVTTKRLVLQQDRSKPFSEIYASVGIGGGQFRLEEDIDNGVESVGIFGSLAVRVIEPINLITEWTGQDLTIGVSVVPFRNIPLVIVPAVTDVTGAAGDGGRVILGVGYSISF